MAGMTESGREFCDNCIFAEGSRYCIEHCPHEAKVEENRFMRHWIPLTRENEPIPYKHYLFTTNDGYVVLEHWGGQFSKYTAYMELPEPYKGEAE